MDFALAIKLNRDDLLQVVVGLCAMVGLVAVGPMVKCLPRALRLKVLMALRPAEAAARRLIVLEARSVSEPDTAGRGTQSKPGRKAKGFARLPSFPLIDPRKCFDQKPRRTGPAPRMFFFDGTDPVIEEEIAASPDDPMDSQRLLGRLMALRNALEDLPKQAQRMARLLARRAKDPKRKLIAPIRPGWPPGHRKRHIHPVDAVLAECHALAMMPVVPPDTS